MNKSTSITLAAIAVVAGAALLIPSDAPQVVVNNPPIVRITWTNNYVDSRPNEYSIVVASTDLSIPVESWPQIFATTNGYVIVPETNSQCFFGVYNYDPDTGEMSDLGGK